MKNIEDENRALRGGSWIFAARYCRASYRRGYEPGFRSDYVGFRVALSARASACAATPQDPASLPSSVLPSYDSRLPSKAS